MQRFCSEVPGPKLANMLEYGKTPVLPPKVCMHAIVNKLCACALHQTGAMMRYCSPAVCATAISSFCNAHVAL
jgi:2-methylisocitrate lyase-like PEP mutase family enzyme